MANQRRNLVTELGMDPSGFVRGSQIGQASAKQLQLAQLRLIAAEERLQVLRASGVARAGQLASAQAGVIAAQDRVAKATRATADVTLVEHSRMARAMDGTQSAATKMSTGVGLAGVVAGGAVVAMARQSIDAASGLQEQLAATRTMFKDAADDVIGFAESAEAIGVSERAALQAANAYGDMFVKLGYTHDAAAVFSEDLVRISADFASFKDLNPDEVMLKLRSGLSGEAEPLRALGIFLNEAAVKAEAMALGLGSANGVLTESEKVTARYSLILKGVGEAQGDVARTADSYANTQRRAAAATENLKAEAGEQLLPIMTDLSYLLGESADLLGDLTQASDGAASSGGLLADAWGFFQESASALTLSGIADALRGLQGETDDAAGATDYLTDSQAILANKQNHTREEVEQATQVIAQQEEAMNRLLEATIAQFDSEMAYTRAVLGITDAIAEYDAALATNRDGKADNDISARELRDRELELSDALLQAADAAVKQAEDHAAAAGTVLSESEKYTVFREELLRLKEQFPQLAGQIDGYVSRLEAVPAEVNTTAQANTAPATDALSVLNTVLTTTGNRVANPAVDVLGADTAIKKLSAIDQLMAGLTGKSATPKVNNPLLPPGLVGDGPGRGGGNALNRVRPVLDRLGGYVTSTYRTPAENRRVGGSPTSYHLDRDNPAVDIGGPPAVLRRVHSTLRSMGGWRELLGPGDPGHSDHVHAAARGVVLDFLAHGGLRENHVAQIAPAGAWRVWAEDETGGEAYIPLSPAKRRRSVQIWQETGRRLNMLAEGGIDGGAAEADYRQRVEINNNRFDLGLISVEDHLGNLDRRMAREQQFSNEWMSLHRQREQVLKDVADAEARAAEETQRAHQEALRAAEEDYRRQVEIADNLFEAGRISLADHLSSLDARIARETEYTDAWVQLVEQRERALQDVAAVERAEYERQVTRLNAMYELGELTADQHLRNLDEQLAREERYSSAWMALHREREGVLKDIADAEREAAEKVARAQEEAQDALDKAADRLNGLLDEQAAVRGRMNESTRRWGAERRRLQGEQVVAEAEMYAQLAAAAKGFADRERQILAGRRDALAGAASIDQIAEVRRGLPADWLVGNARQQVEDLQQWAAQLGRARRLGVSEQVIAALGLDEGPQALEQLRALTAATGGEIDALNQAVADKSRVARAQARREQRDGLGSVGRELAEAQRAYAAEVRALERSYAADRKRLTAEMRKGRAEFLAEQRELSADLAAVGVEQGRSYTKAVAEGMRSELAAVRRAAREVARAQRGVLGRPGLPVGQPAALAGVQLPAVSTSTSRTVILQPTVYARDTVDTELMLRQMAFQANAGAFG